MTFNIEEYKAKVKSFVEKYSFNEYLEKASAKTKVDKEYLFVGVTVLIGLLIYLICGTRLIIDIVGFVYPLYASLQAIESADKEDDKQWLTYWIIFTKFKIVESVAGFLIPFIPFYFLLKAAFLIWCYHPSFNGATVLYDALLKEHLVPMLGITSKSEVKEAKKD
ncbi:REEP5 [Symbiodinium microadriaticum]|nr:REEP5 [Symbiodinium microadriaticum]